MSTTGNHNTSDKPSLAPKIRGKIDESLLDIIRKEQAIEASKPVIEKFIEELFFHISKCSDETLKKGNIQLIISDDISSGDYNISNEELPQINNSIRIINQLFKISHGEDLKSENIKSPENDQFQISQIQSKDNKKLQPNYVKVIDIDNLPPQEITRINVAIGSKNLAEYLALIVNHENSSRKFLPQFSPAKVSLINLSATINADKPPSQPSQSSIKNINQGKSK